MFFKEKIGNLTTTAVRINNVALILLQRVFQRLQGACQEGDWFFPWVAETSSIGGQRGNKEWEGVHTKHKIVVGVISVRTEQNLIWHLLSTYIQ